MRFIVNSLFLVIFYLNSISDLKAQIPYTFSVSNEPFLPIAGTAINDSVLTDTSSFAIPIGFDFKFDNKTTNKLFIDEMNVVGTDTNGVINGFSFMGGASIVDRGIKGKRPMSFIRYMIIGDIGSRILKVEFSNIGFSEELSSNNTLNDYANMQVWLYETSNIIELRFGTSKISDFNSYFGLGSAIFGYFNNLNTNSGLFDVLYYLTDPSTSPSIDSFTISSPSINALNTFPINGTVYRFNPRVITSSIKVDEIFENVSVYPTSSSSTIHIVNNSNTTLHGRLITSDGKDLKKISINKKDNLLDMSSYSIGQYFLLIYTEKTHKVYRINK